MGKKSRKKRELKMAADAADPTRLFRKLHASQARAAREAETEKLFQERLEVIRSVFRRYRRFDTSIALCISDLWPANVASPVKHIFAWGVLLELEPGGPDALPIASYAEFSTFAQALYAAWPEFPMLEDFTPEADWGHTRVRLGNDFVPMFYGSCIERTPDFIEAFRISYAHLPEALAHMDLAVAVQTRIIDAIPSLRVTPIVEPRSGVVEVPPEDFWEACRSTLLQVGVDTVNWRNKAGHALETAFGAYKAALTWNDFGDACIQGIALPFLATAEGNDWIPVSVRSGPGVVIDYWAAQRVVGVSRQTHRSLARFIVERFRGTLMGPLTLVVDEEACNDLPVSCVISAESGVYLICACDHATNGRLSQAAKRVYGKLRKGASMHFLFSDGRPVMLSKDGAAGPSADELRILIVLTKTSTALGMIDAPERPTRLMSLADFITVFDSLENLRELDRYWKFIDEQRGKLSPFSTGAADLFAAFRDSHGVLVDGAALPHWIGLDPHWGTTWRFRELTTFWSRAPRVFPDGSPGWNLSEGTEGVVVLESRHHKAVAYSTTVGACTVQAMVAITPGLAFDDARLIDLFAQLLADSLNRCKDLISDAPLFGLPHLVFSCEPDPATVTDTDEPPEPIEKFPAVVVSVAQKGAREGSLRLVLDIGAVLAGLNAAKDGAFEIRCLVETLALCHAMYGMALPSGFADRLQVRALEPARYHLNVSRRHVDVPDHVSPVIPSPTEYKLARKRLALVMKELKVVPGRYELAEAKVRIDMASERLRFHIESRLASLDRPQLLKACIEEHDALLVAGRLKMQRVRQSLSHAVEYDRIAAMEEARKEFASPARHYRYLLEKVVSSRANGVRNPAKLDT